MEMTVGRLPPGAVCPLPRCLPPGAVCPLPLAPQPLGWVGRLRGWMARHPSLSTAIVYGGLYTLAELSQQNIRARATTGQPPVLDTTSLGRYAVMGTVVFPPIMNKWYTWIDRTFPSTSTRVVTKKLFMDQFLFTPWVVVIFYVGMATLEGRHGRARWEELRSKGLHTFALDTTYWLPVNFLNFMFVPAWLRVPFIAATTFIWLNILAYIKAEPAGLNQPTSLPGSQPTSQPTSQPGSQPTSQPSSQPDSQPARTIQQAVHQRI